MMGRPPARHPREATGAQAGGMAAYIIALAGLRHPGARRIDQAAMLGDEAYGDCRHKYWLESPGRCASF